MKQKVHTISEVIKDILEKEKIVHITTPGENGGKTHGKVFNITLKVKRAPGLYGLLGTKIPVMDLERLSHKIISDYINQFDNEYPKSYRRSYPSEDRCEIAVQSPPYNPGGIEEAVIRVVKYASR